MLRMMHCTRWTLAFAMLVTLHVTRTHAEPSIDAERHPPSRAGTKGAQPHRRLLQIKTDYSSIWNSSISISPALAQAINDFGKSTAMPPPPPFTPPPPSLQSLLDSFTPKSTPTPSPPPPLYYYSGSDGPSSTFIIPVCVGIGCFVFVCILLICVCVKCCCQTPGHPALPPAFQLQPPVTFPPQGIEMEPVRDTPPEPATHPIPICHPTNDDDCPWDCPVCMEDIWQAKEWTLFPCGHGSCNSCYQKLLEEPKPGCPLCRLQLTEPKPEDKEAKPISLTASSV